MKNSQLARRVAALTLTIAIAIPSVPVSASDPGKGDWPMWGGTPDRNMLSNMKGLPTSWDVKTKKNVKWITELGSQTYGNTVVADGKVFVGTNNEAVWDPKITGDKGILIAFRESDGEFLWQAVSDKLTQGRVVDWPFQGICSSPLVEGKILYYVTSRGEVVAVDTEGFRDGQNNGPFTEERLKGQYDADILWRYDMMEELGVQQHNMANSSPVSYGDLLFIATSNGQDESHANVPAPKAPSIIAVNKKTGKLVWEENSVEDRVLHGQWSTPAVGKIGDVIQAVVGQGDGWVRGYEATSGKKLWEFDMNPKDSVWPKTRNEVISTPIIVDGIVYIANGQDPEHGEGVGHLYAIDGTKRGDITKTGQIWHYDEIRRSVSTGAYYNGLLFYADFSGFLHCVDAKTGKKYWKHDLLAAIWGSPIVIGGRVYLGDEDGDVVILEADKVEKKVAELNMGSSVYSTPVPANGTLYVASRNQLFALAEGATFKTALTPKDIATKRAAPPAAPAKSSQ